MAGRQTPASSDGLLARLSALTNEMPSDSELRRLLGSLDDPANDELSKDRYTALVAGGAVDEGLRLAIERRSGSAPKGFASRIDRALELGLVSAEQTVELQKIRQIRNVFAHALTPTGFSHPAVKEAASGLWVHPVTSWAGYFAPAFAPRHQFAIVCGEFHRHLASQM